MEREANCCCISGQFTDDVRAVVRIVKPVMKQEGSCQALDCSKFATPERRDFRQFLSRYPDIRDEIAALTTQRREMNRQLLNEAA